MAWSRSVVAQRRSHQGKKGVGRRRVSVHGPASIPEPENVPDNPAGKTGTCLCSGRPRSDNSSPAVAQRIPGLNLAHRRRSNFFGEHKRKVDTSTCGKAIPAPDCFPASRSPRPPGPHSSGSLQTGRLYLAHREAVGQRKESCPGPIENEEILG